MQQTLLMVPSAAVEILVQEQGLQSVMMVVVVVVAVVVDIASASMMGCKRNQEV